MRSVLIISLLASSLAAPAATLSPLLAQSRNLGLSPSDQQRYDELMQSARGHMAKGILATRFVAVVLGMMLIYAGRSIHRKGFKLWGDTMLPKKFALGLSILLAIAGVALAIGGWIAVPHLVR
jgi:hypothetical protein